jgi:hypothetical protein
MLKLNVSWKYSILFLLFLIPEIRFLVLALLFNFIFFIHKKYFRFFPICGELTPVLSAISYYLFGFWPSIFFSIITIISALIFVGAHSFLNLFRIPIILITLYIASLFQINIIVHIIIFNVLLSFSYFIIGMNPFDNFVFQLSNIIINIGFFMTFGKVFI